MYTEAGLKRKIYYCQYVKWTTTKLVENKQFLSCLQNLWNVNFAHLKWTRSQSHFTKKFFAKLCNEEKKKITNELIASFLYSSRQLTASNV